MSRFTLIIQLALIAIVTLPGKTLANSFTLTTSEGGTLYLHSKAVSDDALFLIDTGSSLTVLNDKTFAQIKASQSVKDGGMVIARLANGRQQKVRLYTIPVLTLSNDCEFHEVSVAVMNNTHNILGMEVLSRAAPFGITLAPARLTFSQCDGAGLSAGIQTSVN